jgi:hypothetical protein
MIIYVLAANMQSVCDATNFAPELLLPTEFGFPLDNEIFTRLKDTVRDLFSRHG